MIEFSFKNPLRTKHVIYDEFLNEASLANYKTIKILFTLGGSEFRGISNEHAASKTD